MDVGGVAPAPPSAQNWLGTDDTKRDVTARVIYGFRSIGDLRADCDCRGIHHRDHGRCCARILSAAGPILIFQRFIEIRTGMPSLYVIIIVFAILGRSYWLLVFLTVLFGWPALVGVVRAEFLRARNLEYVRAAKALGVRDRTIMFRHMLPNAMVATLTMLPFLGDRRDWWLGLA